MSTLAVVETILREAAMPLSVREIVERAGEGLPTKSKTPDTVVARDLSMDIKKKAEGSTFVRTSPGRYAIRQMMVAAPMTSDGIQSAAVTQVSSIGAVMSASTPLAAPVPASVADSTGTTPLVGQSLPHERSGPRPVSAKPQSKSEDTPMSA